MTTASPVMQFPWPIVLGALAGVTLAVATGFRSLWGRGATGRIALVAAALSGASAGSLLALIWLWIVPMSRPVACLYSCAELNFLSNEQVRQIMVMTDLAWILPMAALFFGAISAWALRLG